MFQKIFAEKIKTHIHAQFFIYFENNVVYELIWKNIVEPDRPHLTV